MCSRSRHLFGVFALLCARSHPNDFDFLFILDFVSTSPRARVGVESFLCGSMSSHRLGKRIPPQNEKVQPPSAGLSLSVMPTVVILFFACSRVLSWFDHCGVGSPRTEMCSTDACSSTTFFSDKKDMSKNRPVSIVQTASRDLLFLVAHFSGHHHRAHVV